MLKTNLNHVSDYHARFTANTECQNRLGLREVRQRYADEQWLANPLDSGTGRRNGALFV